MEKNYSHKLVEERIYKQWEENGYFKPEINPNGKPYCIILPPPNANGSLHFGHAMFTIEDLLIRYHRMKGFAALWLPGTDHAGIETQFVFEKKLQKEGKSRLDYDRDTLYEMIRNYVDENRGGIENQLRRLGFSLDWTREKYTLDPEIVKLVCQTFKKMYDEELIYRGNRLVNYCARDGTSFSDLEVVYEERSDPLYYIKYGPLVLATTRPETKFGDTAVAVNPNDDRYKQYIGQIIDIETVLGRAKIKVIADESVDPEFGTGAVKITPAHDFNDFEVGKRHNLEMRQVIGFDGKLNDYAGKFAGLYVKKAREAIVAEMQEKGLMEKIDENYVHRVGVCYKCKTILEPLPLEQWFIKTKDLALKAIDVVKKGEINIFPKNFENWYFQWLENLTDWNISRQIIWGIRIPAWYCGGVKTSSQPKMGFHKDVVPQVFDGKTKTYRLRDHNFKEGDRILFENTQTKTLFGYGIITEVKETIVDKIDYKDPTHYKTYADLNELMKAFKLRNPDKDVTPKSKAYLYAYEFHSFDAQGIERGCGQIIISSEKPEKCPACGGNNILQDPDTFDTWFSSGQWPFATLMSCSKSNIKDQKSKMEHNNNQTMKQFNNLFDYFYPTSVMETAYDILKAWVSRMVMLGVYITGEVPFRHVLFHGIVNDPYGKKMSKSRGNVVNPLELVDQYGADSVRFALVYGNATGNDQSLSYTKLDGARKFINKLWNIGRFIEMKRVQNSSAIWRIKVRSSFEELLTTSKYENDKTMINKVKELSNEVTSYIDNYQFNLAAERLYEFTWHEFADKYIEDVKNRLDDNSFIILNSLFLILLKLLHPFIPFVTEELFKQLGYEGKMLIVEKWPSLRHR